MVEVLGPHSPDSNVAMPNRSAHQPPHVDLDAESAQQAWADHDYEACGSSCAPTRTGLSVSRPHSRPVRRSPRSGITDLGHGRHLVEAPDLTPWYPTKLPDPDTLAQARADFGPMIITKELIANSPPPRVG